MSSGASKSLSSAETAFSYVSMLVGTYRATFLGTDQSVVENAGHRRGLIDHVVHNVIVAEHYDTVFSLVLAILFADDPDICAFWSVRSLSSGFLLERIVLDYVLNATLMP